MSQPPPETRIHITGASGSGTTTLGRALAGELRCSHLDSDDFFWQPTQPPYQTARGREERQRLLGAALRASDSWVLSGSLCGWGDLFTPLFDLVVFLWLAPEMRMRRLYEREVARYGRAALSAGGERYEASQKFLAWAAAYDDGDETMRSRRQHEAWLGKLSCPVLRLEGELCTAEQVRQVRAALG